MNLVQLMVFGVLMFCENIELLPSSESNDLSTVNIDPTKRIILVLVVIPVINQRLWV